MNQVKTIMKCPICGKKIQEGKKDYLCMSFAARRGCNFCVSKKYSLISFMVHQPLNADMFQLLITPAGLTIEVDNKFYNYKILSNYKNRIWHIDIRESNAGEVNYFPPKEIEDDNNKNLESRRNQN